MSKLLRIHSPASNGFVLTDFPNTIADAEELETLYGGLNAFVHLSLPERFLAQLEEAKLVCQNCETVYYGKEIEDREFGIRQAETLPEDGHCFTCGSHEIVSATDIYGPERFEAEIRAY